MARNHRYNIDLTWTGNTGAGTAGYRSYERAFELAAASKPAIAGSADPAFRGDRARWNPEELLVGAIAACHQLWFLHLCSDAGVVVEEYADSAEGVMEAHADGTAKFIGVTLRPRVTVQPHVSEALLASLHTSAHERCVLAQSVTFSVECEGTVVHRAAKDTHATVPTSAGSEVSLAS